ncbi:amidase [Paraburkholderia edwinii]|uniref:Amidase n=1 Tax=Paraburkholderia edwinii TaxID=2861782 RepID=A0ABX8URH6_9BURK|nr:amidase family protein [Paraburkholderia edwinii]QYD71580.1 amidase [Paraburkholderia edwinii]
MNGTSVKSSTALAIARAFAQGLADPVAVTAAALDHARGMRATFISVVAADRALRRAEESAERWRRKVPLSVLDGVPIAWKDLFDIAGLTTTAGSATRAANVPALADAALVARAERAGMITVGKTNLSEFAYSGLGLNPHFGTPTNSRIDHGLRVPGGSSSGAAISVAAGVVPISVGTDTAGSIRIPSAFNGLTGYRASIGRYSRAGMVSLSRTLDTIGPIANTVSDCAAFDAVVQGVPFRKANRTPRDHRFVIDLSLIERYAVSELVASNFLAFIERLRESDARVEEHTFTALADIHRIIADQGWIGALEAFETHRALLDSDAASTLDPYVRARLERARHVPSSRRSELLALRNELQAVFVRELKDATLIVPTVSHTAPLLAPLEADPDLFAAVNMKTLAMTMPASFLDAPVVAMPSGLDGDSLPTGVQLIRSSNDDDVLLSVAQRVEQHMQTSRTEERNDA